jgi:hypothetical protein
VPQNKQTNQRKTDNKTPTSVTGLMEGNLLADLAEAGKAMDELFGSLQSETGDFVGTLIGGFHSIGDYLAEVLKLFGSFGGGNGTGDFLGSLLSFLPGGELLGGIFGLFGDVNPGRSGGGAEGRPDEFARQPNVFNPNITVVVNSEIESSKAVKFLTNYMPMYNVRNAGSAI